MRLLICAGGTGGGVYPALSVLQAANSNTQDVLWVGSQSGMEAGLVSRQNVPFAGIPAAGVHGVGLRSLPGNMLQLARGVMASRRILKEFRPDVILFTGGYVAVPMAVAARNLPKLLYVPDIEPGLALKTLARFASLIALTVEESQAYFSTKIRTVVTGYPTRPDLHGWDRTSGRAKFGLRDDLPVLLVFGGSKGARSINRALLPALPRLLPQAQVIHISGELDWTEVEAAASALAPDLAANYHPMPYLHEMGAALASADLAVCRAGASALGELPLFGLPAVLVPYPYAWRYQRVNASFLEKNGAALVMEDRELPARLADQVEQLLRQREQLNAMRKSMQSLARPEAAQHLADLLVQLGSGKVEK